MYRPDSTLLRLPSPRARMMAWEKNMVHAIIKLFTVNLDILVIQHAFQTFLSARECQKGLLKHILKSGSPGSFSVSSVNYADLLQMYALFNFFTKEYII